MIFRKEKEKRGLWKVGVGAGIAGGLFFALRYMLRPAVRVPMPETISPQAFSTRVFESSFGQIVYHEAGQGTPLLFIHGVCLGASSYEWSKVYAQFASDYRVVALDLLGFGESERSARNLSYSEHVQSLAEFVRSLFQKERPVLVGSGLGGGLAAVMAAQHPELLARLFLLMPTGLTEFGRRRLPLGMDIASRIPVLKNFLYRNYLSRQNAMREWMTRFAFTKGERVTEEMIEIYTNCAQQSGAEYAIYSFLSGRFNFNLESRLSEIQQPVTLIWSEKAIFPPLEWAHRFQRLLKIGSLVVLHDTGMLAALETPDALASVLRQELNPALRVVRTG